MKSELLSLSIILLFAACEKGIISSPEYLNLTASLEQHDSESKTSLSQSLDVLWSRDDRIRIFDERGISTPDYSGFLLKLDPADDGKKIGHFTGTEDLKGLSDNCYALYPENMFSGFGDGVIKVNVPEEQYCYENSFSNRANISLAYGKTDLSFKNVCGLLAVQVERIDNYSSIKLTTLKDEALWGSGEIQLSPEDATPVLVMTGEVTPQRKTITLNRMPCNYEQGGQFIEDRGLVLDEQDNSSNIFYFVVPVGSLGGGFIITISGRNGEFSQKYSGPHKENEIIRSVCTKMPPIIFDDNSEVLIRNDVKNKAFYKEVFIDDGVGNSGYKHGVTETFDALGFTYDLLQGHSRDSDPTQAEAAYQDKLLIGDSDDINGICLYPDGEPRFKVYYHNGGASSKHGIYMKAQGREHVRTFFLNGGSYVGSCGGAYNASTYKITALHIWPVSVTSTEHFYTECFQHIEDDSPLLRYGTFPLDHTVKVIQWGGPWFEPYISNYDKAEVYARFTQNCGYEDSPEYQPSYGHADGRVSIAGAKPDIYSGRMILSTGHPEYIDTYSETGELFASMIRYGMDDLGIAKVKGILHNGEKRFMTKSTSDNDPSYTKVGDKQCHHFAFAVPAMAKNIKVRLESLDGFHLSLRLAKGTFAFKEDAKYADEGTENVKELKFKALPQGTWYIGVQCEDTVTTEIGQYGTVYTGGTEVLNGAAYSISVSWEIGDVSGAHSAEGSLEYMDITTL